jgi:hypothetical protein
MAKSKNPDTRGLITHLPRHKYAAVFSSRSYVWIMPKELLRRWSEVARCGWENVLEVAQHALLDDTERAIKAGEIRLIGKLQL